jgi:hypothetical protein
LAHGFRDFNPWSLGPKVRQNIMAGTHGGAKLITLWQQKAKRERKGQGD